MSSEEFRTVMKRAFTGTGWLYAAMLTAKEAVGYMAHIPWYEMLAANIIILMICTPLILWIFVRYWNGDEQEEPLF
jgi:hypothetical protein